MNESKCKRYIRQICSGLDYVHRNHILHLDMKPFSVVFAGVDDDSDLRITDFGLARRLDLDPSSGHPMPLKLTCLSGTIEFISPEMVECSYVYSFHYLA